MAGRTANLKPWKPGQSGNPGGRPKRDMASEIARAVFERDAEAIEHAFAAALRKGDATVFRALADRAYGKPRQQTEHTREADCRLQSSVIVKFIRPGETEVDG